MTDYYTTVQAMGADTFAMGLYATVPTGELNRVRERTFWVRLGVRHAEAAAWVREMSGESLPWFNQGQCVFSPVPLPLVP